MSNAGVKAKIQLWSSLTGTTTPTTTSTPSTFTSTSPKGPRKIASTSNLVSNSPFLLSRKGSSVNLSSASGPGRPTSNPSTSPLSSLDDNSVDGTGQSAAVDAGSVRKDIVADMKVTLDRALDSLEDDGNGMDGETYTDVEQARVGDSNSEDKNKETSRPSSFDSSYGGTSDASTDVDSFKGGAGLLARLNIAAASYTASNNSNNNTSLQSLLSLPLPDPKYNADDDDLLNDAEFFPPPPPEQPGLRSMHDSREKDGEKGENGKRVKVGKGTSPVSEASSGAATPTVARHFNGPKHNQTPETAMTTIPDNTEETDTITNLIHDTFPSPPHSPSSPTAPPTSSTPHPTPPTYFNDPTDPLESRTRSSSMATTLRRLSFEPSPPLPHPCSPKWWVFDTAPARVTDDPLSQYIVGVTRSHPSTSPEFRESPAMKRLLPSPPSIDSDAHLSPRLVLKAPQTTTVDEYIEWVDTVDAAIRHRRTRRPTISSDTDDDHDDTGTMVLIDLSTLRRVITRSTQNTSTQPDVSSCHPSHQKDPSPRQPSIQLDAKSLDHLSKLVALATDLDEMAGIEETEEVANPPSKFGTWGEGSNRQSRAFPNHRFSTGFFSPPSSSTHKRISMSVWKPPQNDEKEQMDDEDDDGVGWGIDPDTIMDEQPSPHLPSATSTAPPPSTTPTTPSSQDLPTHLLHRLSRSVPVLRNVLDQAHTLDTRLLEAEARLRARDEYLGNTIMDTARRVQELEGLTADLEGRNEELVRELERCMEEREELKEVVRELEEECGVMRTRIWVEGAREHGVEGVRDNIETRDLIREGLREEIKTEITEDGETEWREVEVKQDAKDVNVQTDYILSPTPPTLPFKITRSKAIQCTFPSSAASPDSPTPPSPTRQESKLLSLKIRLSYANTIMALQNETIEQLESQITLYRDQQDSQAIQTAQTDTRIHHVEAIGATKDRVVEELSRRLMVLETEQLATSLRKRVGGEQQRMTHRRTASATALDSRRAIPHSIDTTLKNMLKSMEDAALGSGIGEESFTNMIPDASPGINPATMVATPSSSITPYPAGYRGSMASTISMSPSLASSPLFRSSMPPSSPLPRKPRDVSVHSATDTVVSSTDTIPMDDDPTSISTVPMTPTTPSIATFHNPPPKSFPIPSGPISAQIEPPSFFFPYAAAVSASTPPMPSPLGTPSASGFVNKNPDLSLPARISSHQRSASMGAPQTPQAVLATVRAFSGKGVKEREEMEGAVDGGYRHIDQQDPALYRQSFVPQQRFLPHQEHHFRPQQGHRLTSQHDVIPQDPSSYRQSIASQNSPPQGFITQDPSMYRQSYVPPHIHGFHQDPALHRQSLIQHDQHASPQPYRHHQNMDTVGLPQQQYPRPFQDRQSGPVTSSPGHTRSASAETGKGYLEPVAVPSGTFGSRAPPTMPLPPVPK